MTLPPFPSIPQSPEERLRWVQWGEQMRAMERERCAEIAATFSNGTHRLHPDVPFNEMNQDSRRLAHWTAQCIAAAIDAARSGGKGDGE